ncbi:MAG TPA: ATP-binding protein [Anaerolineales bacterium]|nr:ATP-binding protein [Anaerolineales bacterium]
MKTVFSYIRNFFTPPMFVDDENKTRIARMLHVILLIFLVSIGVAFFLAFSGRVKVTNQTFFNISAVIGPLSIITLLIALQKGYVHFVAWAFVSFQWFSTVIQVIGSNGLESPALGAFIVTILLAGFLINRRGVLIFGALSSISIFAVAYLEINQQIPSPIIFTDLPAKLFILLTIIVVGTAVLYMVMRTLQKALGNSRTYAAELEQVVQGKTRAENEVIVLNQQLQQQVEELERFTYTVSHDLRSPLVTIKGFLGMLNQDLQDNRPDKIQSDFDRITGAADKMDALLTDLLELSRIGRKMNPPEDVQFMNIVEDALENVHGRIEPRGITVQIQPNLPVIHGDRQRLTEALQNLVDNAAKYIGDQTNNPRIEIGQRGEQDGKQIFFVKDNGIGIATEFSEQIFGLFNKLNSQSEGTGIGLALVKRIIETHGGKIWVESEGLGKGSTFFFTLPK